MCRVSKGSAMGERQDLRGVRNELVSDDIDWRGWVQFVFLNGGEAVGNAADLRRRVCEAVDQLVVDARPKWQPIETAPKDGKEILIGWFGYFEPSMHVAFWHGRLSCWCQTHQAFTTDKNWQPTHWMPLPEPPIAKDSAA